MSTRRLRLLSSLLLAVALSAQETPPGAVAGVRGVRQEGSGKVREVDPASKEVPPPTQGVQKTDAPKAVESPKAVASPPVKSVPSPAEKAPESAPGTPPPPPAQGVKAVDGTKPPESVPGPGVKPVKPTAAKASPPPPAGHGVHEVEGQKPPQPVAGAGQGVPPPPTVKSVAPPAPGSVTPTAEVKPPAGIKPVPGVTGIDAQKQRNLEAALQAKAAAGNDAKKAKAAAGLLQGPPAKPKVAEKADDRRLFEEARKIPDNGS